MIKIIKIVIKINKKIMKKKRKNKKQKKKIFNNQKFCIKKIPKIESTTYKIHKKLNQNKLFPNCLKKINRI